MERIVPSKRQTVELQRGESSVLGTNDCRNTAQQLLAKWHVTNATVSCAHACALTRLIGEEAARVNYAAVTSYEEATALSNIGIRHDVMDVRMRLNRRGPGHWRLIWVTALAVRTSWHSEVLSIPGQVKP